LVIIYALIAEGLRENVSVVLGAGMYVRWTPGSLSVPYAGPTLQNNTPNTHGRHKYLFDLGTLGLLLLLLNLTLMGNKVKIFLCIGVF
jgi:hypothetical protein